MKTLWARIRGREREKRKRGRERGRMSERGVTQRR